MTTIEQPSDDVPDDLAEPALAAVLPNHPHHWMIAKQDGPTSEGICTECSARKDFLNSFVRSYAYRQQPPA